MKKNKLQVSHLKLFQAKKISNIYLRIINDNFF